MRNLAKTLAALILLTAIWQASALEATKDGYTIVTSEELRAMISRQLPGLVVIDARWGSGRWRRAAPGGTSKDPTSPGRTRSGRVTPSRTPPFCCWRMSARVAWRPPSR